MVRSLVLALILLFVTPAEAQEQFRDPDLGDGIVEGSATRENIWLLGQTRKVVRFERMTGRRDVVAENVIDILADEGRLWVISQANEQSVEVRDLRRTDPPVTLSLAKSGHGEVLGLFAALDASSPSILTQRQVLTPDGVRWRRQGLAGALDAHPSVIVLAGQTLYVGYSRGEWGGGLRAVDVATGTVGFVTEQGAQSCDGRLSPECDPVVGAFVDPIEPDCAIVGSGLAHLGISFGDVYRVCGAMIRTTFSTPTPSQRDGWMIAPQPWPLHGLYRAPGGWVGVSRDRYFRSVNGRVSERALPRFSQWSGLSISEEQDDVLFIVSACCWGSVDNPTLHRVLALPIDP